MTDYFVSDGWHWSYGILRRSDLDQPYGYCYEMPDGDQVFTPRIHHHKQAFFTCLEDAKTGEKYLTLIPSEVKGDSV
jgi:hypothetical protein